MKLTERKIIMRCMMCSCEREAAENETPTGRCMWCREYFGWTEFPLSLKQIRFELIAGDIVTVDTRKHPNDPERIFEIERNGVIIYGR